MSVTARALEYSGSLPRHGIAALPTPLERLGEGTCESSGDLWVKRDDLTGEPYGGNKVRKLEFHLGEARARGSRAIVTFGAVGSNHVLATATYGAREAFEVHAILTPQRPTPYLARNLAADVAAGATLHFAESAEDASRLAAEVCEVLRERDEAEPFVIPFGGTSPVGTLGFVNAAFELAEQVVADEMPEPDVVYVPLGSMGTAAGLAVGLAACEMRTRVVGVRVVAGEIANESALDRVVDDVVALIGTADESFPVLRRSDLALEVREGFLGEEYAHATHAAREAVSIADTWGLDLETTYTGKALAALLADARAGVLDGSAVLFWNTYNSRPLDPGRVVADRVPEGLRSYLEGELT